MARRYTSFLVRCWRLDGNQRRIKVEHIQSGEWAQVTTLAEAVAWLGTQWVEAPADHPAVPSRAGSTPGQEVGGETAGKERLMTDDAR